MTTAWQMAPGKQEQQMASYQGFTASPQRLMTTAPERLQGASVLTAEATMLLMLTALQLCHSDIE